MPRSHQSTEPGPEKSSKKSSGPQKSEAASARHAAPTDRVTELSTLMGISTLLSSDRPLQEVLATVCKLGAHICKSEVAFIHLADGDDDLVCVARYTPEESCPDSWERVARVYGRKAVERGEIVSTSKLLVQGDPREGPGSSRMGGICSVPLMGKSRRVGTIAVGYPGTHRFLAREKDMLSAVAAQVTMAVERSWLFDRLQEELARANSLREVANRIGSNLELDLALDAIVDQAASLLAAEFSAIFLLDEAQRSEVEQGGFILSGGRVYGSPVELKEGPLATALQRAVETGGPFVAHRPGPAQGGAPPERVDPNDYPAALAVPLFSKEGVMGALVVCYLENRRFDSSDVSLAQDYATQASMALQNAWLYEEAMEDRLRLESAINQINNHGILLLDDAMNLRFANPASFWLLGVRPRTGEMPLEEWVALMKKGLLSGEELDQVVERILAHPEETVVASLAARGTADLPKAIKLVSLPLRQTDGSLKGRVTLLEEGS